MEADSVMQTARKHSVTDFAWRCGVPVRSGELAAASDPIGFSSSLRGQFALHEQTEAGEHRLARDLLGVNKLFFAVDAGGQLESSNWLIDLVRMGYSPSQIFSVPPGYCVQIRPAESRFELSKVAELAWGSTTAGSLENVTALIRTELRGAFELLVRELQGRQVWVTLSGGLDSSLVAALARDRLPGLRGMTFCLGAENDDLRAARGVAAELNLPLDEIHVAGDDLSTRLDAVLESGQDWRDFNVHCALVNDVLAERIAELSSGPGRPVVLTGDTMNELVADYAPVVVAGHSHYDLPGLSPARLRRFLVGGLDAGDREVGVFARHGVDAIQPFALCAEAYAALPGEFLDSEDAKSRLVRAVVGDAVPEFVHERPKVRAQVGNADGSGGVLSALVSRGLDQEYLTRRFSELFGIRADELSKLIRAGRYRSTSTYPVQS